MRKELQDISECYLHLQLWRKTGTINVFLLIFSPILCFLCAHI